MVIHLCLFHLICKSYLKLGKEFQSISYDAITAHTAIVMTRYIMLAVENRNIQDSRTMGELFFLAYDELHDMELPQVLIIILDILQETLYEMLFLTNNQMDEFIDAFITKLPKHILEKLLVKKAA